VLHLQEVMRSPLNVLADLMTMSRSIQKRPQDEHVKGSLENSRPLLRLFRHRRHSTPNLAMMVDIRQSSVKEQRKGIFQRSRRGTAQLGYRFIPLKRL
jgi:hypothetical protein